MAMLVHPEGHLDHILRVDQLVWLLLAFKDRTGFFIQTVTLPGHLGTVPCGLYGPLMGDMSIPEDQVVRKSRGQRTWTSRIIDRPSRLTDQVTIIAGPHDGLPCVVFTIFGGPPTPQEPDDPDCKNVQESKIFWDNHALTES